METAIHWTPLRQKSDEEALWELTPLPGLMPNDHLTYDR